MKYYLEEKEKVIKEFNSSIKGLSSKDAEKRLAENGKNVLVSAKKTPFIIRFLSSLKDPMLIILIVASIVSGALAIIQGDSLVDAVIILSVVFINAFLSVIQEGKAEKAIEALKKMSAQTSKVIRNGEQITVKSEDLVVGDIIVLEAGDSVPVDARIIECASLKVEESALTGESVPVNKIAEVITCTTNKDVPLGDRKNCLYTGSTVVYGRCKAVVTATAMDTEMGKIADALSTAKENKTPLQIKLTSLSKILTAIVLIVCAVVFGVQLLRTRSFTFNTVLDSFMIAVSLAVAAIPEGLAAVVTVVLSIGVTNMSKRNAIIRKMTAVETLGSTQIICSDKTGTLTQNKMTVVDFYGEDESYVAKGMALCSDAENCSDGSVNGEPTEAALVAWANKLGMNKNDLKEREARVGEAPFDSNRKMMTTVHLVDKEYVQYTKGAVDSIVERCSSYIKDGKEVPITDEYKKKIYSVNKEMADKALRVLVLAIKKYNEKPSSYEPEDLEKDLCFVGLCGMIDPVRPEVKAAIEECKTAGIRPIMITGDHKDTAVAIAKELGILSGEQRALSGSELDEMDDETFEREFKNISVYARVQPEHKTRIVSAWQKAGYVTAMTGDGVNDAPSIKTADIGVGMGITGTDVTKNVADMVLADDNFATIVKAVSGGRRIYDNIRKAIQFLLSSNMSEVISIFVATLIGFTILKPVHLLWINLVTDCFTALALGTERAEYGIMSRKPRSKKEGLFANGLGFDIAYQGLLISLLTLSAYFVGVYIERGAFIVCDSALGTTMAFITMSFAELFHAYNMRSLRGSVFTIKTVNKFLLFTILGGVLVTTAVCEIPFIASAFSFTSVGIKEYAIAFGLGVLVIPIVEIVKLIERNITKRKK